MCAELGKDRYLMGESIVLDLELRPSDDATTLTVPHAFDPGYSALRIFFETPLGERRVHRSPYIFCHNGAENIQITRRRPLRHNPRITVGSNDLNFKVPGEYRLWAEFSLPRAAQSVLVRSNELKFEVFAPRDRAEEEICQMLSHRAVAFFIANKGGALPQSQKMQLLHFAKRYTSHEALQHVRYALAVNQVRAGKTQEAAKHLKGLSLLESSLVRGLRRLTKRIG